MSFTERRLNPVKGTINLIGGNVEEAKILFCISFQAVPIAARGFQEPEGTHNVGLNKLFRAVNGAVNMALSGKIDDRTRPIAAKQVSYKSRVTDITLYENVALIFGHCVEVLQVTRVGKYIEVHNRFIRVPQPIQYEICTDEA